MDATLEQAVKVLRRNQLKITKQRQALLDYLVTYQHHYVAISAVDDHMRTLFAGMSHNTIYRNIKEFETLGLLELKAEANQTLVKYQCDFKHQHHHHFVCSNCGRVMELQECPLDDYVAQLPGCTITGHRIEIYGLCADCTAKQQLATK
ncbi:MULTISPECIES: Fur family transcriptional regulator [Lactiplantibacillus]|jgi:Fur family zinc uptake transcriptional regulator|uniref:Fur family transcriptional regulator n=2 Tax=Lactiplantibacillus TaxID=2767842 RepID=A0ABW1R6C0_9LACO|nr:MULTISPECIES: Fur family transcriptional regulator [Lactiplantibacillus]